MELPSDIRTRLGEHLPPAACRLFEIILRSAVGSATDPLEMSANKDQVLAELEQAEGRRPDEAAVRQRLQTIRKLLKSDSAFSVDGRPCLTLKSTKYAFLVIWSDGAREKLGLDSTRKAVVQSGHDDYQTNMGGTEPVTATLAIPAHRVLLSHNWENPEIDEILDAFAEDLQRKLRKLPAKYAGKFTATLLYDRNGDIHGRATFDDQIDRLCMRASMAVFMTSNGWIQSAACQREAGHFERRREDGKDNPFVHVQLCDHRRELPKKFEKMPIFPAASAEFVKFQNLLDLRPAPPQTRDKFVAFIRDQICDYLLALPGPPEQPEGSRSPGEAQRLKDWLAHHHHGPDVADGKRIRAHVTADKGDDRDAPAEGRLPAVDTLYGWATGAETESRMLVLLGGFGMGKTTTVQLLHERLRKDLDKGLPVPTPIYLDFRRLIPATEPGKAIKATLADLVASSLHGDARSRISGEKVIDLIRSDRCVVIFDGLDEVGNRIGREYAIQLFRQFLELIPADAQAAEARAGKADWNACQTRLILTCRTHFFRTLRQQNSLLSGAHRRAPQIGSVGRSTRLPGIDTYYMAPLTLEQIAELFERHLGEELGRSTFGLIRGIHDLPGLASRPIMARFISEVAGQLVDRHRAGQPINIATIYEELFQLTLERDAEKRPLMSAADRRDMLCMLATHFHCEGVSARSADDLERWFDGFAASNPGIMLTLRSSTADTRGLLHTELENASLLVRGGDDRFSFAHTSYYEYFLALALSSALFAAGTGESLAAFCARPISLETMAFIEAIAVRDGREAELVARWKDILRSDAKMPTRRLAFDMLRRGGMDPFLSGANLADFDLRGLRINSGATVAQVNFARAALNGLDARQVTFRDCDFDRTILANARLDGCRFEDVIGSPAGLASARGNRTELPGAWQPAVAASRETWTDAGDYRGQFIVTSSSVSSAAFSADGRRIVTGSDDKTARVWDAETGHQILVLEGHGDAIGSVAFSADSRRIVTGSDDKTARVWDAETGHQILVLKGHWDAIGSVAFSADGRRVVTGSDDSTALVWDVETARQILQIEGRGSGINSTGFSADGRRIVVGADDGAVRVWDAESGRQIQALEGHGTAVSSAMFSADGRRILTGSDDHTACVWDAESGRQILALQGHRDWVNSAAFSADGRRIVTGSDDTTARVWDAETGRQILALEGHGDRVSSAAFSADGRRIITGSSDTTARVWDAETGHQVLALDGYGSVVGSAAFSADGRRIVTGSDDSTARVWDAETGRQILVLERHRNAVSSTAFSVDNRRIVTGARDGTARVWDAETGRHILALEGHGNWISSVEFSADGRRIVTGSFDTTARVWDAETGRQILVLDGYGKIIRSAAFSADSRRIVTGCHDNTARVWDAETGRHILALEGHGGAVGNSAFSADGRYIVTGSFDKTARVWDAETGRQVLALEGHGGAVSSVAFSADGRRIVTGSFDRTVRVWDAKAGRQILEIGGHGNGVCSAAFSADGRRIVTGSFDRTARVWDAETGHQIARMAVLPESWASLGDDGTIRDHGPNLWRYVA